MDDRRATLVAAGLVAAVVVVLGFGSGFWGELARSTSSGAAPSGRDLGTVVQPGPVAVGVAPGTSAPAEAAVTTIATVATAVSTTTVAPTDGDHHVAPTTTTPASGSPVVAAASCSAGTVAPFWTHFEKAHLETSPGQQVADAASLDQYLKTHTVLIAEMLTPIIESALGDEDGPGPFWTHFEKAHLETSPGQQVADALSLDQYVKTHTVLVEDLLSPIIGGTC
jgi:hypothetical protein